MAALWAGGPLRRGFGFNAEIGPGNVGKPDLGCWGGGRWPATGLRHPLCLGRPPAAERQLLDRYTKLRFDHTQDSAFLISRGIGTKQADAELPPSRYVCSLRTRRQCPRQGHHSAIQVLLEGSCSVVLDNGDTAVEAGLPQTREEIPR